MLVYALGAVAALIGVFAVWAFIGIMLNEDDDD